MQDERLLIILSSGSGDHLYDHHYYAPVGRSREQIESDVKAAKAENRASAGGEEDVFAVLERQGYSKVTAHQITEPWDDEGFDFGGLDDYDEHGGADLDDLDSDDYVVEES